MADSQSSLTDDQINELARAAGGNAVSLVADARLLLDAGRYPRAYALAVLALEELGKVELCGEVLAGELEQRDFRRAWSRHDPKLWRAHLPGILFASTLDRIFASPDTDHAMRLRGLYVDLPLEPGGIPRTPLDIEPTVAEEIVTNVESVAAAYQESGWQASLLWPMEMRAS